MSGKIGLGYTETLLENLDREIAWGGTTTFKGWKPATETLSSVGSVATPTKTLTAADSGMTFFVDISTVNIVATLPTPAAGLNYKFVLSVASDNEASKDFLLNTHDDDTDINGSILVNGAHVEVTNATSAVAIDSSDGAATVGDFLEVTCDGTDWYITGSILTASAINIANAADGHTLP